MQKQINAVVSKFTAIEGSYESNVLQGVWHAYCDSGIMTDALSVNDYARCAAAGLCDEDSNGICYIDRHGLHEINIVVKAHDAGSDLDCVQCVDAIEELGYDVEEFFSDVYSM